MTTVKEACEKWGKEHGICVTPSQLIEQLQAELEKHRWIPVSEKIAGKSQ